MADLPNLADQLKADEPLSLPYLSQAAKKPPGASKDHHQRMMQPLLPVTSLTWGKQEECQNFHPYVYQSVNLC